MKGKHVGPMHVHPAALGLECLPCPFCGSGNLGVYMGRQTHITCGDCGADGPLVAEGQATLAVMHWNARMPQIGRHRNPIDPRYE